MAEYVKRQHPLRHIGDIPGHLFYGRTCLFNRSVECNGFGSRNRI